MGTFAAIAQAAFEMVQALNDYLLNRAIPGIIRALGVAVALTGLSLTLYGTSVSLTGPPLLLLDLVGLALVGIGLFLMWYSTTHPVDVTASSVSPFVTGAEWALGLSGATAAILSVVDHNDRWELLVSEL